MDNYVEYILDSLPSQHSLFDELQRSGLHCEWRVGDSDAQGKYIKGYLENGMEIAVWLGESPATIVVNSRRKVEGKGPSVEEVKNLIISVTEKLGFQIEQKI
jgi:hypothetical protein